MGSRETKWLAERNQPYYKYCTIN